MERLGLRSVGPQQGRELLEQFLYLGREGGEFCKKIHSNYRSSYCSKEKIEFEIMVGESNSLAAAAPDRDDVPVSAH